MPEKFLDTNQQSLAIFAADNSNVLRRVIESVQDGGYTVLTEGGVPRAIVMPFDLTQAVSDYLTSQQTPASDEGAQSA